tara:strand:- start:1078 stop:1323 length:246 start_codon:yes stop_codon:yes gene_type:complete
MTKLLFTFSNDDKFFSTGNSKVIVAEGVPKDYREELCDIIEDNKLSYQELKHLVESWGGTIEMFLLTELLNNKKTTKGVHV